MSLNGLDWTNVTDIVTDDVTSGEANTSTSGQDAGGELPLSGFVDSATRDAVIEVVNCYLLPVVFLFGVCGNVMSFVVLVVHGLNNSTNVLLMGVTVSDLAYLLTMYARKVSCVVAHFDVVASRSLEVSLIPTVYMVHRLFGYTTPFLTMIISLERCLAVTLPFQVQTLVTPLRMKVAVSIIFIVATAAQFPFFFIYEIRWTLNEASGQTTPMLAGTPFFYNNFQAITVYNNVVLSSVFNYVPLSTVIICTVVVLTVIRRSARWRKVTSQGGERPEERRMTKLLMTVIAVFITCYVPRAAVLVANSVAPHTFNSLDGRYRNLFYVFTALQGLLFAINSSANFLIYMLMSSKFYNTYVRIFLCRKENSGGEATQSGLVTSKVRVTSTATAYS